jgi:hypothetical protein
MASYGPFTPAWDSGVQGLREENARLRNMLMGIYSVDPIKAVNVFDEREALMLRHNMQKLLDDMDVTHRRFSHSAMRVGELSACVTGSAAMKLLITKMELEAVSQDLTRYLDLCRDCVVYPRKET